MMRWLNALSVLVLATPAFPCLVFCISDGKHVFGGNNEDYMDPKTRMWIVPGGSGEHGRVYFGFDNGFPQGGVNDAGLFFDGLALDHENVPKSDKPAFPGNLSDRALAECSSVEQVVERFERYDRNFLADAQLLFGDRSGDAAIIEGNAVIRKHGSFLLATNFRQSKDPPATAACERYRAAGPMLSEAREASLELCRKVLSATHQESPVATVYSNVYDLEKGLIYLYHFHDFENVVIIDLAKELAKGAHVVELSSLFPQTFALANFERQADAKVAAQREKERDKNVVASTFDAFVGRFRVEKGVAAGLEFRVRRDKDRLFVDFAGQEANELIPKGGAVFVCLTATERAEFSFSPGKDGAVREVTIRQSGVEALASRVE